MAEILKSIDSSDLAEAIAELNRRIEQADSLDRCIAKGLLRPSEWFNKYEITATGKDRLASLDRRRAARAVHP